MGRTPLPTEIKRLKGTLRPCRTNPKEPVPTELIGDPPEYMSDRAKEIWFNVVQYLPKGVITACDSGVLETYCNMSALREELQRIVNEKGAVLAYKNEISAHFNALDKANKAIAQAGSELGLTPASRQKVSQGYGDPTNDDEFTIDMFNELDAKLKHGNA